MAIDFSNKVNLLGGDSTSQKTFIRNNPVVLWYTYGGVVPTWDSANIYHWHRLCSVNSIDAFAAELENETDTQQLGKKSISTNDGTKWTSSIELDGADAMTVMAMLGQSAENTDTGANTNFLYNPVLQLGSDEGIKGALMLCDLDANNNLVNSQLWTEVVMKLTSAPGASVGNNDTFTLELESRGEMFMAAKGCIFVPFMFYDNGTITNSAAPDGTLTTFNIKNANNAFSSAPTYNLPFQRIRYSLRSGSSPEQYVVGLRSTGSLVSSSSYSVTQANGEIDFNTAPSDGAKLEGIVCLATGFAAWSAGTYRPGDIVENGGSYWKVTSSGSTTEEPTGTPTDWTELTDQQFAVPYISQADGAAFEASGTRNYSLYSWLNIHRPNN